jgi:TolB protein
LIKKTALTFIAICLLFALLNSSNRALARIYLDIDSPNFNPIPIAICDFNDKIFNTTKQTEGGISISEGVKQDLALTGIFNILTKKSFLEEKSSASVMTAEKIRFSDWTAIGADYLLRGNVIQNDKEIIADCYLYDTSRGELIFNKKYLATADKPKDISRSIAMDIMRSLINDEGDFKTKIAFVSKKGLKSDIYSINYDGSELMNVTNHKSILLSPRWSPDGNWLAFTSFKMGRPEIYIRNLKTGSERKMASFEGLNLCGAFSPDGKKILLTLSKDGNNEIYTMDIDSLTLRRLTHNYSIDVSPSWSPDGKKIVFVSNRSGSPQIYKMDADGSNEKRLTYEGNYNSSPSWSPHGNRIVYEGLTNNKYQIFTVDEEGNNSIQLTFDAASNESPSWSPSGRQIVYVSQKHSGSKIFIMNSNGLNMRLLYEAINKLSMPVWSPRMK